MKVLFTWELGAGLGHLTREAPVALALRRRGHQVMFAVRDTRTAEAVLSRDEIAFLQAPIPVLARPVPYVIESFPGYASILAAGGFGEVDSLHGLFAAWRHLFAAVAPDAVVCDFSPAAQWCARISGYPTIQIALPWELPPGARRLPAFPCGRGAGRSQLAETERRVLANMREVCRREGAPRPGCIGELYAADISLITGLEALDCFAPRRKVPTYIGPLYGADFGVRTRWPRGAKKVFAYLQAGYMQNSAALEATLDALTRSGAAVVACVPGASEALIRAYSGGRMVLLGEAVCLDAILRTAHLVITNAGSVTLSRCALAGVPMLLLPYHMEQRLNAARAKAAGIACVVQKAGVEAGFSAELKRMLNDAAFAVAARALADRNKGRSVRRNVEHIARLIESASGAKCAVA